MSSALNQIAYNGSNIQANSNILEQPITELTIETIPGVEFYLAKYSTPVIVNSTGLYSLKVPDKLSLSYLSFPQKSLDFINSNKSAQLIINMFYEGA